MKYIFLPFLFSFIFLFFRSHFLFLAFSLFLNSFLFRFPSFLLYSPLFPLFLSCFIFLSLFRFLFPGLSLFLSSFPFSSLIYLSLTFILAFSFFFLSASRPTLGPTQPPIQWVPGVLSPGVKRGRGMTLTTHPHLVPRSRMSRSYTSSPPMCQHGV
jgi:hypothetical protein